MKKLLLLMLASGLVLAAAWIWLSCKQSQKTHNQAIAKAKPEKEKAPRSYLLPMMAEHQLNMLRDPHTGNMLCIAVDVDNENHLLAGSASGGMWESNTEGNLWHKVTAPDAEQSATCVAQDRRTGKHHTWYYGSGELLSTTNRNVSTSVRTVGLGNGIFKSTDNGSSWQALPSTQGGQPGVLKDVFQGVWRIVTDPVTMNKDVVYAACYGAIMRSENG
ncbi:MAG: hypothetical protein NTY96_03540, partial [Bacteroidetes bacterium]|nr:hypothetical protein [Bacteroidota bacterium]